MPRTQKLRRLLNRASFSEAGRFAQAIANGSGHDVRVRRLGAGFSLWVADESFEAVYPVAARLVEQARHRHWLAKLDVSEDDGIPVDDNGQLDAYMQGIREELLAELAEDDEHYASSNEDGWFYPDGDSNDR